MNFALKTRWKLISIIVSLALNILLGGFLIWRTVTSDPEPPSVGCTPSLITEAGGGGGKQKPVPRSDNSKFHKDQDRQVNYKLVKLPWEVVRLVFVRQFNRAAGVSSLLRANHLSNEEASLLGISSDEKDFVNGTLDAVSRNVAALCLQKRTLTEEAGVVVVIPNITTQDVHNIISPALEKIRTRVGTSQGAMIEDMLFSQVMQTGIPEDLRFRYENTSEGRVLSILNADGNTIMQNTFPGRGPTADPYSCLSGF